MIRRSAVIIQFDGGGVERSSQSRDRNFLIGRGAGMAVPRIGGGQFEYITRYSVLSLRFALLPQPQPTTCAEGPSSSSTSPSSPFFCLYMAPIASYNPSPNNLPLVDEFSTPDNINGFNAVERDQNSFAGTLPADQGLYSNENEKDSCGVGFICQIKGEPSHKIVSDARQLLCAMTHRGATGADSRDGDGAGVMTAIPHDFFKREAERDLGCILPDPGQYAVGNVFFKANDAVQLQGYQSTFTKIAIDLGLRVLGWREVPTDGTILGPAARSKEPIILQPFVVLRAHYGDGAASQNGTFDQRHFECQLYVLRKHATHRM